jgi:PAS domain S-box-containing protein
LVLPTGKFHSFNDALLNLLGYTHEEFSKMNLMDVAKSKDEASCIKQWDEIREKQSEVFECLFERKDGIMLTVEVSSNMINYNENEINFCYINNITEKLNLERTLKLVDFSFRNADLAMHFWRKDGTLFEYNEAGANLLGYTIEEFKNIGIFDVSLRHTAESWIERFEEFRKYPNVPHTSLLRKKDNSLVSIEVRSSIIVFEDLELCFSSSIDVTEKLGAEKEIKESNQRYEYATLATSDVIWEADLLKKEIFISKNFTTFFGHPVADGRATMENNILRQNIHQDEIEQVMKDQHDTLNHPAKNNWIGEYQIKKADGSYAIVIDKTFAIKDDKGNIIRMVGALQDVTNLKKEEKEKKQLTERLQLATQSAKLGIWDWDLKSDVLTWDEGMYKLYNIADDEFNSVFEGFISRVHQEDRQELQHEMELGIANIKEYKPEFRVVWNDSSVHYINASSIIERDNDGNAIRMIGTNWDVTVEKEKERHLKLLESVITNTTDSVLITEAEPFDEPGPRILYVNDAFTKMTGYTSEEVIGKTPRILQRPKSDRAELKRLSEAIRGGETCEISTINYKKNGEEFWVNVTVTPVVNEKGWCTHWIAIERDITDRKLAEIQLNDSNKNLQDYASKLALSNAELEQFAYIASHDIQEPLRMVTSFLTQLEKKYGDVIDDKGKLYIGFAVDGAKRMRQIILDLLEYSKVGRTEYDKEELDLNNLIDEIKILFRKTIEEKNAILIMDELPKIHAYLAPMRQVFQNLINNALKYSNKEIPVQIHIAVKELKGYWQFAIIDNGIGIKKEYHEKIFAIFQKLHTKEEYPGTGLGLAIVKKIIEANDGKIWVESEEGKGSSFYFTIKK